MHRPGRASCASSPCCWALACEFDGGAIAQFLSNRLTPYSPGYWDDPLNWKQQFVPDSRLFWDNSLNWTTNYGPAYRDTIQAPSEMLACSTQFALCFHSGAEPYPLHAFSRRPVCQLLVHSCHYHQLHADQFDSEPPHLQRHREYLRPRPAPGVPQPARRRCVDISTVERSSLVRT